jgi:hypothetical protein
LIQVPADHFPEDLERVSRRFTDHALSLEKACPTGDFVAIFYETFETPEPVIEIYSGA